MKPADLFRALWELTAPRDRVSKHWGGRHTGQRAEAQRLWAYKAKRKKKNKVALAQRKINRQRGRA